MTVKIYHNPRCSKSRQTLELIRQTGVEPEIILYLETPPQANELTALLEQMNIEPHEAIRSKEAAYKENNLGNSGIGREQIIATMVENPTLIERPIVATEKGTRLCRPPELVKEIL